MFTATSAAACPPPGFSRPQLLALKDSGFVLETAQREALALAFLECLGDPDPVLRDGIAFGALSTWMRGDLLSQSTATAMLDSLLPRLALDYPDPDGVLRSFSALASAEVARMDRLAPFLPDERRGVLVAASVDFLRGVVDHRGFDAVVGWRHSVAHGADLTLQLALNPLVGHDQLSGIVDAIGAQIAPRGEHSYIDGEPERLARAIYYVASRDLISVAEWSAWFEALVDPAPLAEWSEAFQSRPGLAKRHNTVAFLQARYLMVREGDGDATARIVSPLMEAIGRVP
jgi:hypothetical protein